MSRIAFFDFDGTVTTKDSFLEVIKFQKGKPWFYFGFLLNSPILIAYKIGLVSNQTAKERILTFFFGKTPVDVFEKDCADFSESEIDKMVRPRAMEEIGHLKAKGFRVVLVSASPASWLTTWAKKHELELIATSLEVRSMKITGKIEGKNCYGEEKVRRIKQTFDLSHFKDIYCYGDTRGDMPMLKLGTIKFYKPFR